ncbi:MAG: hypothetical protein U0136_01400 [Bdellovibrionota bacterium]
MTNRTVYLTIAGTVFVLEFFMLRAATNAELWQSFLVSSAQVLFAGVTLAYLLTEKNR